MDDVENANAGCLPWLGGRSSPARTRGGEKNNNSLQRRSMPTAVSGFLFTEDVISGPLIDGLDGGRVKYDTAALRAHLQKAPKKSCMKRNSRSTGRGRDYTYDRTSGGNQRFLTPQPLSIQRSSSLSQLEVMDASPCSPPTYPANPIPMQLRQIRGEQAVNAAQQAMRAAAANPSQLDSTSHQAKGQQFADRRQAELRNANRSLPGYGSEGGAGPGAAVNAAPAAGPVDGVHTTRQSPSKFMDLPSQPAMTRPAAAAQTTRFNPQHQQQKELLQQQTAAAQQTRQKQPQQQTAALHSRQVDDDSAETSSNDDRVQVQVQVRTRVQVPPVITPCSRLLLEEETGCDANTPSFSLANVSMIGDAPTPSGASQAQAKGPNAAAAGGAGSSEANAALMMRYLQDSSCASAAIVAASVASGLPPAEPFSPMPVRVQRSMHKTDSNGGGSGTHSPHSPNSPRQGEPAPGHQHPQSLHLQQQHQSSRSQQAGSQQSQSQSQSQPPLQVPVPPILVPNSSFGRAARPASPRINTRRLHELGAQPGICASNAGSASSLVDSSLTRPQCGGAHDPVSPTDLPISVVQGRFNIFRNSTLNSSNKSTASQGDAATTTTTTTTTAGAAVAPSTNSGGHFVGVGASRSQASASMGTNGLVSSSYSSHMGNNTNVRLSVDELLMDGAASSISAPLMQARISGSGNRCLSPRPRASSPSPARRRSCSISGVSCAPGQPATAHAHGPCGAIPAGSAYSADAVAAAAGLSASSQLGSSGVPPAMRGSAAYMGGSILDMIALESIPGVVIGSGPGVGYCTVGAGSAAPLRGDGGVMMMMGEEWQGPGKRLSSPGIKMMQV